MDWSLITGRGATKWENRGSETFCMETFLWKLFLSAPPPLFVGVKLHLLPPPSRFVNIHDIYSLDSSQQTASASP